MFYDQICALWQHVLRNSAEVHFCFQLLTVIYYGIKFIKWIAFQKNFMEKREMFCAEFQINNGQKHSTWKTKKTHMVYKSRRGLSVLICLFLWWKLIKMFLFIPDVVYTVSGVVLCLFTQVWLELMLLFTEFVYRLPPLSEWLGFSPAAGLYAVCQSLHSIGHQGNMNFIHFSGKEGIYFLEGEREVGSL